MGHGAKLGLAGLVVTTVGLYVAVSNAYGGDKQAMMDGFHVLAERLGPSAMPVFVLVHTIAIALCFPYAIVFEAAASFLFGFLRGVLCVFSAKVMGAALAFWLGRSTLSTPLALSLSLPIGLTYRRRSIHFEAGPCNPQDQISYQALRYFLMALPESRFLQDWS
jgi:hypothetical protein